MLCVRLKKDIRDRMDVGDIYTFWERGNTKVNTRGGTCVLLSVSYK